MENKDYIDILMELNGRLATFVSDIEHIKQDMNDMKIALKELVSVEKRQQRLEDDYKRIIDCCDVLNELKNKVNDLNRRISEIEEYREKQSERFWKVFLGIIEKIIIWLLLLVLAFKDKIL